MSEPKIINFYHDNYLWVYNCETASKLRLLQCIYVTLYECPWHPYIESLPTLRYTGTTGLSWAQLASYMYLSLSLLSTPPRSQDPIPSPPPITPHTPTSPAPPPQSIPETGTTVTSWSPVQEWCVDYPCAHDYSE